MDAKHDYQFLGSNDSEVYRRVSLYRVLTEAKARLMKMAGADQQRLHRLAVDVARFNQVELTPTEQQTLVRILERHAMHRPVKSQPVPINARCRVRLCRGVLRAVRVSE